MSPDVYIDLAPPDAPDAALDAADDSRRLGHAGLLAHFDLRAEVDALAQTSPRVDKLVAASLAMTAATLDERIDALVARGPLAVAAVMGPHAFVGSSEFDVADARDLALWLLDHLGWRWRVRVG